MNFTPRPYQTEAVDSLYTYFYAHSGNPLLVLPTGAGKSWVQAMFIKRALSHYPHTRILVVSHVKELLEQNADKIVKIVPNAPLKFCSAGIGQKAFDAKILVCGIQTAYKYADRIGHVDLMIVDESHLIPEKSETMYRTFIDDLLKSNPRMKVIGMTATPYRLSSGLLYGKDDSLFDDICYELPIAELIKQGHLTRLVGRRGVTHVDLSNLRKRGGEFLDGDLQQAFDHDELTTSIVGEIVAASEGKKGILIFSSGVAHAEHMASAITEATGERVEVVSAKTKRDERERIVGEYKAQQFRWLINYGVFTTGFDAPHVDLIALCRATMSTGLYVQILGRGMRLSEGKQNCVVLDYGGNIERHGPIDRIRASDPKSNSKGEGDAPIKECPVCMALLHLSTMICPECEYEFPKPDPNLDHTASDAAIMSEEAHEWWDIRDIEYVRHSKANKPDSMRVIYHVSDITSVSEWVCFEHMGYARRQAEKWAMKRKRPIPTDVSEALEIDWPTVSRVKVDTNDKWPSILEVEFGEFADEHIQEHAEETPQATNWWDTEGERHYDPAEIFEKCPF